jgi:8-oxo-dGTP pyrophosphatase MutT (NUDIX family)
MRGPRLPSGEFRRVGERPAYQSKLLHVFVGSYEAPDGSIFERDIVRHPGAVVVVPYDDTTGEVVLVRQYRAPVEQVLLEVPAGKRDVADEPTEVTAARELAEEAALEAGSLSLLGRFYNSPGFSDEESWCYLARDLHPVPGERQGIEEQYMTVERRPLSAVASLVASGDITDAKTIVGLFMAQAMISGAGYPA